jgi:tRNA A-37 threonylcarbamoyl transferase component Bud32
MNYDSLIKNQTYLFQSEKNPFLENDEFIFKIFEDANLNKPSKITFNTSTINYDILNISSDKKNYILKFSLDEFDFNLKNEFNLIKKFNCNNTLRPVYYNKFKFGDYINYSIYLDENYESVKDFGLGIINDNIDEFIASYFNLQNSIKPKIKHKENIINFIKNHSISFFDKEVLEAISNNSNLNKIEEIINSLHSEIFLLFQSDIFDREEFCHGDLNQSNILYCFDHFKFINLCDSFMGNSYCDLANLVINSNLNKNIEKKLFNSFLKEKNIESTTEQWIEYRKCFDLVLRKIFLEILFNFLKEIYLFESHRPAKLLEIIEIFSQNQNNFLKIPIINNNFEFIYNLLLEPLIGKAINN